MPPLVANGALLKCSFGLAPSSLLVTPEKGVSGTTQPIANIADQVPVKNIPPFGMCNSMANPTVAAATAAALGVLTPMPCVPVIPAPWVPGAPMVKVKMLPALNATSKCMCTWGGVIEVTMPGQMKAQVK